MNIPDQEYKKYLPLSHVRSTVNDDGGVLLSLVKGRCFALNPVGARVWSWLERSEGGLTLEEVVNVGTEVFTGVTRDQVRSDMLIFLNNLESKSLITNGESFSPASEGSSDSAMPTFESLIPTDMQSPKQSASYPDATAQAGYTSTRHAHSVFTTFVSLLMLVSVDVVLRLGGFYALYRIIKKWPVRKREGNTEQLIPIVIASIDRACAYYIKRALCLQRSVATTLLLRLYGVRAEMVIAARVMPFHGHAWVEVGDEVVNDSQKVRSFYSVMDRW